ncbi:MAG: Na+:solute symporter [Planctomycetales bacterium]|nr:Na+:solute symporter [Planctomycetales bacterium]
MQLDALDWLIIISYFLITLGIGVAFSFRAGTSLTEYFVSGRSLPWWLAGTSMVATTFAADTPLAVTGLVAKNGLAGNWFWWAFAMGGMFTVFVYARMWRRAEVLTDVELVEVRYGGQPAAVLRGVRGLYIALIVNPIIIGWVTNAMVTVLKETVLYSPTAVASTTRDWQIIAASLVVVGIYATLSGLWGVAATDFIQFFVAMTGCILLAIAAVGKVGGMQALHDRVVSNFGGGEQAFKFLPDFVAEDPWMPLHVFCVFLFVQWWATWYPGAEPGGGGYIVQRMASCKDERHSVLATLWYQVAHYCIRPWPWLLVAFAALAMYPELREYATRELAEGAAYTGTKADVGFARVIRDVSPSGLRGLMLVTFFAAFMSTISTQMNWGASYLVCDVYQRFSPRKRTDKELTFASRVASVFVLIIGGIAAYAMRDYSVDRAWKMLAALGAGTGAVFMLRWFWWRINAWTEIVAMVSSLIYFQVINAWVVQRQAEIAASGAAPSWLLVELSRAEVQTLVVAIATILTWLAATFMTAPEDERVLLSFYRKVRPGGPGWKPVARLAPEVETDQHLGSSLLASLLAGTMIYCILPAVGCVLFGRYADAVWLFAGAFVCAVAVYLLLRRVGWERMVA